MDASVPDEHFDQLCRCIATGRQASRKLAAWVSRFDLKESEFRLLWLLRVGNAPLDQSQLAGLLASSPAQVSALVERLRGRGFLSGEAPPGDRRRCQWKLTTAGNELLAKVIKQSADQQFATFANFLPIWRKSA